MLNLFTAYSEYYYVILILQGLCVFHIIRNENQSKWIWIVLFLPAVGCIAYLFSEILTKRQVSNLQNDVVKIVNPGSKIKELEKRFAFTQTFANRVALADAYLEKGLYEQAVELYEPALAGLFEDNEYVITQLIQAYYHLGRYEDIAKIGRRVAGNMNFSKSRSKLLYALALEQTGNPELAGQELRSLKHRFSNYEARYNYGMFLIRQNKNEEAEAVFCEIVDEAGHLSRKERTQSKIWIAKATEEWNKLSV